MKEENNKNCCCNKDDGSENVEKKNDCGCKSEEDKECSCSENEIKIETALSTEEILKQEIEKIQSESKENLDKFMRLNAEFVNYKNRVEKEKMEFVKYAGNATMKLLLPFLDTFDSALKCEHKNIEECVKGFQLVYNSLFDILKKEGLEIIKTEGEKFNPEFHEAIGFDKNEDLDEDVVTVELQKGYKLKDKVLRHSMVKVNKK